MKIKTEFKGNNIPKEVIKFKKCKLSYCNMNLFEKIESINNYRF